MRCRTSIGRDERRETRDERRETRDERRENTATRDALAATHSTAPIAPLQIQLVILPFARHRPLGVTGAKVLDVRFVIGHPRDAADRLCPACYQIPHATPFASSGRASCGAASRDPCSHTRADDNTTAQVIARNSAHSTASIRSLKTRRAPRAAPRLPAVTAAAVSAAWAPQPRRRAGGE